MGRGGSSGGRGSAAEAASKKELKRQVKQQRNAAALAAQPPSAFVDQSKLSGRAGRFGDGRALGGVQSWQQKRGGGGTRGGRGGYDDDDGGSDGDVDLSLIVIVGTCQALEKSYFRLTAAPVRPPSV